MGPFAFGALAAVLLVFVATVWLAWLPGSPQRVTRAYEPPVDGVVPATEAPSSSREAVTDEPAPSVGGENDREALAPQPTTALPKSPLAQAPSPQSAPPSPQLPSPQLPPRSGAPVVPRSLTPPEPGVPALAAGPSQDEERAEAAGAGAEPMKAPPLAPRDNQALEPPARAFTPPAPEAPSEVTGSANEQARVQPSSPATDPAKAPASTATETPPQRASQGESAKAAAAAPPPANSRAADEPAAAPAPETPAQPMDLSGWWELRNAIDTTTDASALGARLSYRVQLQQSGTHVTGAGRRWAENGRILSDAERSPVTVEGDIEDGVLTLRLRELRNDDLVDGKLTLRVAADLANMRGTFFMNTARTSGISQARRLS